MEEHDDKHNVSSTSDEGEEKIKKKIKVEQKDNAPSENTMKRTKKPVKGVRISPSADISEERTPSQEEITKQLRRRDTPVIPHGSSLISAEALESLEGDMEESSGADAADTDKESSPEKDTTPQETTEKTEKSQASPQVKIVKSSRNHVTQKTVLRPSSGRSNTSKRTITITYKSNKSTAVEKKSESASKAVVQKRSSWSSDVTSKTDIAPGSSQKPSSRESLSKRTPTKYVNPGEDKKLSLQNIPIKDNKHTGNTQTASTNLPKSSSEDKSRGTQTKNGRGGIK